MSNNDSKAKSLIQRLYNYRLKIDRNGKTILNFSSLFSLACLIFAPHMTIAGLILSLILGYHINLETENAEESFDQTVRQAAETVRRTASVAARTIREEVEKAKLNSKANPSETPVRAEADKQDSSVRQTEEGEANAQEIVEELEKHAAESRDNREFQTNPTMYHTAYSASAGTVPTLEVHETSEESEYNPPKQMKI